MTEQAAELMNFLLMVLIAEVLLIGVGVIVSIVALRGVIHRERFALFTQLAVIARELKARARVIQ